MKTLADIHYQFARCFTRGKNCPGNYWFSEVLIKQGHLKESTKDHVSGELLGLLICGSPARNLVALGDR